MVINPKPNQVTTIQDDAASVQAQAASLGITLPTTSDGAALGIALRHTVKTGSPVPFPKILGGNK